MIHRESELLEEMHEESEEVRYLNVAVLRG